MLRSMWSRWTSNLMSESTPVPMTLEELQAAIAAIESPAPTPELPPLSEEGNKATKAALRLLKFRARSRHELRGRLTEKGYSESAVAEAMERMDAWQLLDDGHFARQWVEQRSVGKGTTRTLLRRELTEKGVDSAQIGQALELVTEEDERARAHDIIAQRLARRENSDLSTMEQRSKVKRRLVGFLQRRGYSSGVALSVVNTEIANARQFL